MSDRVAAVVLAAGLSSRMGQPKLLLPWGQGTVIGRVVDVLAQAGLQEIVVVTGAWEGEVRAALREKPVRLVQNPRFAEDQMAYSLAVGFAALPANVEAAMIALGDQPQIEGEVVRQVLAAYHVTRSLLVAPSYRQRRGHPWIVRREMWPEIANLGPQDTMRQVFDHHASGIHYVLVEHESILKDLDTPQDYAREKPSEN